MEKDKLFRLEIVCPDRMFYEGEAHMVEFTTTEGEIGIYKDHIPLTTIVDSGLLTIREGDAVKYAALHGGFAEILPDKVTILAEAAEWPDEIDSDRAEESRQRALERLEHRRDTDVNTARAEAALKRSLTRLHINK